MGKRPASALDDDDEEHKLPISSRVDDVKEIRDQDAFVPSSSTSEAVMPFVSEKVLGKRKAPMNAMTTLVLHWCYFRLQEQTVTTKS